MRKLFLNRIWLALAALPLLVPAGQAIAAPAAECRAGYTVAFFNGVGNTFADATAALTRIEALNSARYGDRRYKAEGMRYALMYNTTNGGGLGDVSEVFRQRAAELSQSGELLTNWQWLAAAFGQRPYRPVAPGYTGLSGLSEIPELDGFLFNFSMFSANFHLDRIAELVHLATQPPTQADQALQLARLRTESDEGRKLLLIAHSQGNLFMNHAYDAMLPEMSTRALKAYHIAPASPTLRGNYILSSNDLVINALRLRDGFETVVNNNITIEVDRPADPTGHTLLPIYLNPDKPALSVIQGEIDNALEAMYGQQCPLSISPASTDSLEANDEVALSAALDSEPRDPASAIRYHWTVTGDANGRLRNPLTGLDGFTMETTAPNVTYVVPNAPPSNGSDRVTVVAELVNLSAPDQRRPFSTDASADLYVGTSGWVGNWAGSVTSSCGSYSGAIQYNIRLIAPNTLAISGSGNTTVVYNGNRAIGEGGDVLLTLAGNTLSVTQISSCQTGQLVRVSSGS